MKNLKQMGSLVSKDPEICPSLIWRSLLRGIPISGREIMFKWTFILRMPWKPVALSHCAWSPVPSPQRDDVGGVTSGLYPLWYLVHILAPHSNWVTWTNGLNYGIVSTLLLHNSLTLNIYWCHSLATCHSPKNNNLNISISSQFDSMVQFFLQHLMLSIWGAPWQAGLTWGHF